MPDAERVQQSTKCKNKRDAEMVESAYRTQLALGKIGIKQLAENERKFHVITEEEEKIYLLDSPPPLKDSAALMIETGISEVYNLKRQNVNIEKGFVQIENGKTASSNRRVWLSEKAEDILQARIDALPCDRLFPRDDTGTELPLYLLNEQHRETIDRTSYKFRLYDCRHTFATRTLETGETDLLTLASILRHSNLNQVQRYAHPSESRKKDAVRKNKTKAV